MIGFAPACLNAAITQSHAALNSGAGGSLRADPRSKSIISINPPSARPFQVMAEHFGRVWEVEQDRRPTTASNGLMSRKTRTSASTK